MINTLCMHLSLSKCYTLKKTVNDTKSIASKRKYIIRGTELIILILFQKIYKSFPYIYSWNCQHYFTIVKYQCQNSLTGAYHHRPHHFSLPLLFYFFFLQESSTNGGSQSSSSFSHILHIIQIDFLLPQLPLLIVL